MLYFWRLSAACRVSEIVQYYKSVSTGITEGLLRA